MFRREQEPFFMKQDPAALRRKVLIVDDDLSNRLLLQVILEGKGFVTHQAADGIEALALFEEWRPDLIFMDIQMPKMDGMEATRRIRRSPGGRHTPIVVVSASALENVESAALAAGANGFMRKPYREEELCRHLTTMLELSAGGDHV